MPINYPVLFPEMAIALVRRASARLPRNHFIFRTDPKWTKQEIKEYLQKVYEMDVERVATINYLGKVRRRRGLRPYMRLKSYKKVYVLLGEGENTSNVLNQR
ncbi:rplW [Symbiodinium sp. KB8]|nr:rplW [Symbiodinium sp. KB8]